MDTFKKGDRVQAKVGTPVRTGTVIRHWNPYAQYRVEWDNGTATNIDAKDLEKLPDEKYKAPTTTNDMSAADYRMEEQDFNLDEAEEW